VVIVLEEGTRRETRRASKKNKLRGQLQRVTESRGKVIKKRNWLQWS
jgi:hypothetical protein